MTQSKSHPRLKEFGEDEMSKTLVDLRKELESSREARAQAEREIASKEEELAELRKMLAQTQLEQDALRMELGRIRQSRSFRLSARLSRAYASSSLLQWALRGRVGFELVDRLTSGAGARSARKRGAGRNAARYMDAEVIAKIRETGLFDDAFYSEKYLGSIKNKEDLIADCLEVFPQEIRDPGPLFSAEHYLRIHPDVSSSGMHPLIHYAVFGMFEGRDAFSANKVRDFLSSMEECKYNPIEYVVSSGKTINILYAPNGNFFFRDIAEYTKTFLSEKGYEARVLVAPRREPGEQECLNLVVAPHEYMVIGPGKNWSAEQCASAIYLNTEQWQTPWFAKCFSYMAQTTTGVLDINPNSAAGLCRLGIKAAFLPIVPIPGSCFVQDKEMVSKALTRAKYVKNLSYSDDIRGRDYDILFVGVVNERRERVISELSINISKFENFIHCPRFNRPISDGDVDMLSNKDLTQIAKNAKILLNIHRDDVGYFEWHRIFLYGVMNGCVVVSEPCFSNSFIKPDIHYIEATVPDMAGVLDDLLGTELGLVRLSEISLRNLELAKNIKSGERLVW